MTFKPWETSDNPVQAAAYLAFGHHKPK